MSNTKESDIIQFMDGWLEVALWDDAPDGAWWAMHEEAARDAIRELHYKGDLDDNDFAHKYMSWKANGLL